ncbi:MAG: hypothetical protein HC840_13090 [Leptolyngbyaceae cyanobacterium RM2_2_4]|nr:hypothetical protein [Leptolyngbyaceae cyanobacterium SM1_4_3]NJO50214.1 hypothetical protein [Leptolyngbyaceae cyanobacterium RM2_2_4]NJO76149.1 hypothetical protein [Leptolyngbyaceae cyanobacterium RM1_406_9]
MTNTIKINIALTADIDPEKLGEAIAQLIRAVTPEEEWAEIAQQMKSEVSEQLALIAARRNSPDEPHQDA